MAPRFPLDEAPDPAVKGVIEESLVGMHRGPPPFQWVANDGRSLIGCYAPLSYTPSVTRLFFNIAEATYGMVNPRYRELAIMGLSSVMPVPNILEHHREIASKVDITTEQYEEGLAGYVPKGLSEAEMVAYRWGRMLTSLTGPVDDGAWAEASAKISKEELVGLVHVIAGYRWVALLAQVNGAFE